MSGSPLERWEDMLWDKVPHMVKYTRTSLEWVEKYVKLTFSLQKLNKDYSKGLGKLIKQQRDRGVDGKSMSKCWGGVMSQLGNVAENHRQLATVLEDIGKKYQDEAALLTEEQRSFEQTSRKVQEDLDASVSLLIKAKEKFFRKQFESQKADENLVRSEDDEKVNQDALDKLRDVADTKKEKYNKAREDYVSQLKSTNSFQKDFYDETLPSILSGMRGVSERSVECVTSLLRRLDHLGKEEWGDLGSIAEEMDSCIEEDFESFLNWVQTENPVPPNFTFEESYKQGSMSFNTMGTLRKSLSRASMKISGGGGYGSRLSLRSPSRERRPLNQRYSYSLREGGQMHNVTRLSSPIQETVYESRESESPEHVNGVGAGRHDAASTPHRENGNGIIEPREEKASVGGEKNGGVAVRSDSPPKSDTQVPKPPEENGKKSFEGTGKRPSKVVANRQESYDDSMNPFADDEDN